MGFFNRCFGKRETPTKQSEKEQGENEQGQSNLAFVLLSEPRLPDAKKIVQAFHDFASPGEILEEEADEPGSATHNEIAFLKLSTGEKSFVALMPAAVPNGEADERARFSLSFFGKDGPPPHCAHLLVTFHSPAATPPVVRLSRFTSLLAAVTKASPAVGVYWGDAGATHEPEFFMSVASDQDVVPRIMLWSGISMAHEEDGRLSLLSLGMQQLNLPDLLLVVGESSANDAVEMMFDLLAYVVRRGEALPEGDTIGRSAEQRLPVHYVPSPIDPAAKVWRVEVP